jgi:hypothetical protein
MTGNFADNGDFHVTIGIFYMPKICDMRTTALLLLRRKACWGFFHPEKSDGFGRVRTRELGYQSSVTFKNSWRCTPPAPFPHYMLYGVDNERLFFPLRIFESQKIYFFFLWRFGRPSGFGLPFRGFAITLSYTHSRTPLDEWSTRNTYLYLITHRTSSGRVVRTETHISTW